MAKKALQARSANAFRNSLKQKNRSDGAAAASDAAAAAAAAAAAGERMLIGEGDGSDFEGAESESRSALLDGSSESGGYGSTEVSNMRRRRKSKGV